MPGWCGLGARACQRHRMLRAAGGPSGAWPAGGAAAGDAGAGDRGRDRAAPHGRARRALPRLRQRPAGGRRAAAPRRRAAGGGAGPARAVRAWRIAAEPCCAARCVRRARNLWAAAVREAWRHWRTTLAALDAAREAIAAAERDEAWLRHAVEELADAGAARRARKTGWPPSASACSRASAGRKRLPPPWRRSLPHDRRGVGPACGAAGGVAGAAAAGRRRGSRRRKTRPRRQWPRWNAPRRRWPRPKLC